MPQWFERTDLNFLLDLEGLTEKRLGGCSGLFGKLGRRDLAAGGVSVPLPALSSPSFRSDLQYLPLRPSLSSRQARARQERVKGRPLIQIGLAVTEICAL
jgi:hypothetical protein